VHSIRRVLRLTPNGAACGSSTIFLTLLPLLSHYTGLYA